MKEKAIPPPKSINRFCLAEVKGVTDQLQLSFPVRSHATWGYHLSLGGSGSLRGVVCLSSELIYFSFAV